LFKEYIEYCHVFHSLFMLLISVNVFVKAFNLFIACLNYGQTLLNSDVVLHNIKITLNQDEIDIGFVWLFKSLLQDSAI